MFEKQKFSKKKFVKEWYMANQGFNFLIEPNFVEKPLKRSLANSLFDFCFRYLGQVQVRMKNN